jgi:Flp pilus assembly protein TadD
MSAFHKVCCSVSLLLVCLTSQVYASGEPATLEKAMELRTERKVTEALAVLSEVVLASPGNLDGWLQMGAAFEDLGKWKDAERCYRRVLEIDRDNADARRNLEQLSAFREVNVPLKASNVSKEILVNRGLEALRRRDYAKALQTFRLLQGLCPDDPRPLFYVASVYERQGLKEKAVATYTKTSKVFPGFVSARINLIILLTEMKARGRASQAARSALEAFPDDYRIRYLARMLGVGIRLSHDREPATAPSLTVSR